MNGGRKEFGWADGSAMGLQLADAVLGRAMPFNIEADLSHTAPGNRAAFLLGMAAMIRATVVMHADLRAGTGVPFNPDWTVAPANMLAEVMEDRGYTVQSLAGAMHLATDGAAKPADTEHALRSLLAREPMNPALPGLLERTTNVPASAWQRLETQYRADLRAGRTDTTKGSTP